MELQEIYVHIDCPGSTYFPLSEDDMELRGLQANHTASGMTRCTPLGLGVVLILI
jgi:hypothetical protein